MTQRVHISLSVSDLERSRAFYEQLFGQPASKRRDGYANFRLEAPPIHLALVESADAAPAAAHFGIELGSSDELDVWLARAQGAGIATDVREDETCCYARSDKFWVRDPDGNPWEAWVRRGDAETMRSSHEPASSCCATAAPGASSCCG